jgi:hypothetical protein
VTPWQFLPQGVTFRNVSQSLINSTTRITTTDLPRMKNSGSLPVVAFSSSGRVFAPSQSTLLQVFVQDTKMGAAADAGQPTVYFEKLTISRFTGKAQLDVTSSLSTGGP